MKDLAIGQLKVLDLTHLIAGSYCTRKLAGFGVEILKIEKSGTGDMATVLIALLHRQMTGRGRQHIDLSQVQATTSMIGDAIGEYSMNKNVRPHRGNRHPVTGFCISHRRSSLGRNGKIRHRFDRWKNQDELDKLIEDFTLKNDHYDMMNRLQEAGVAAGVIPTGAELARDPHLVERGTIQTVNRQLVGFRLLPVPSSPMKLSGSPVEIRRPAPLFGEHNAYVLGEIIGLLTEEIQTLVEEQIIGTKPLGT